jgi:hypothetical protein
LRGEREREREGSLVDFFALKRVLLLLSSVSEKLFCLLISLNGLREREMFVFVVAVLLYTTGDCV